MPNRPVDLFAFALLAASPLTFIAAHFALEEFTSEPGWMVWVRLWEDLGIIWDVIIGKFPPSYSRVVPEILIGLVWITGATLLFFASPVLRRVWLKSKIAWGLALFMSFCLMAPIWYLVLQGAQIGIIGLFLLVAATLNFAGLVLIRTDVTPHALPGTADFPSPSNSPDPGTN